MSDQKVVVVTGGSGVLGSAIAGGFARTGATVIIVGRSIEKAERVAHQIAGHAISANVLDKKSLEHAAAAIYEKFGRVDVLINAAGGNAPNATAVPPDRTFFDLLPADIQSVFSLNWMGTFLPSQVFGQIMAQQQYGAIVNFSSMAAFQPLTRVVAYAAAKAAINNFTQWLAVYMAQHHGPNIRVNAIAPGFFLGEQNRYLLLDEQGNLTERGQQIINHTPLGRFGDPDDLLGTVLWLTSDASRFVTGIVVPVDGGFSAFSGV